MLIAIAVCVVLYAAVLLGLLFGQRKILFRQDAAEVDPATLGLHAETIRLKTEDGESLLAWSIAPAPGRALILYFHGNAGGLDLRVERFRAMAKAGMGVLAIEYRGYASSTGSPSERGLKLDGEAAYAAAVASGVAPERIVPLGESLDPGSRSRSPRATRSARSFSTRPIRRSPTSRRRPTGSCRFARCSAIRSATIC